MESAFENPKLYSGIVQPDEAFRNAAIVLMHRIEAPKFTASILS